MDYNSDLKISNKREELIWKQKIENSTSWDFVYKSKFVLYTKGSEPHWEGYCSSRQDCWPAVVRVSDSPSGCLLTLLSPLKKKKKEKTRTEVIAEYHLQPV